MPETEVAQEQNGQPDLPRTLHLSPLEITLLAQIMESVNFPSAQAKMVAAGIQSKLESL